jgi:ATP synthase protein I
MTAMAEDPQQKPRRGSREAIVADIGRKAERKLKARKERKRSILFGLGMFGLVGWSVAVPTLIGIMIGLWLDTRYPGLPSWTLTLLFAGVLLGCLNAWYWVRRESRHD